MDPWLGARVTGAELGAELLGMGYWPARGLGAELGAVDLGAEFGASHSGAEPPAFNPSPTFLLECSSSSFSSLSGFSLPTSPYLTNRHIGP